MQLNQLSTKIGETQTTKPAKRQLDKYKDKIWMSDEFKDYM